MKILYIAPFSTSGFLEFHGDMNTPSLGGSRKISLILEALTDKNDVMVLSSAMLCVSSFALRSSWSEVINFSHGGRVKIVYPAALKLRPFGGFVNCLRAASIVRKVIVGFDPDAVIVYNTYLFETFAIKELIKHKRLPVCLEVEDMPLARKRGVLNIKPILDHLCWKFMLKKASTFLAVNQPIFDKLPDNKPKTLLPGVIDQKLLAQAKTRSLPFTNSKRLVGYFGALTAEKGVKVLLELVPKLEPPWKLVVTGSGPLANEFELVSKKYPECFQFLGCVSEQLMYSTMCRCDCVLIPFEQITDGGQGVFPFKTLEYLVSGAHIISTVLAGQNELDLSFIMRWDGSIFNLLEMLKRAESDYNDEVLIRSAAIEYAVKKYSVSGINKLFAKHLL